MSFKVALPAMASKYPQRQTQNKKATKRNIVEKRGRQNCCINVRWLKMQGNWAYTSWRNRSNVVQVALPAMYQMLKSAEIKRTKPNDKHATSDVIMTNVVKSSSCRLDPRHERRTRTCTASVAAATEKVLSMKCHKRTSQRQAHNGHQQFGRVAL